MSDHPADTVTDAATDTATDATEEITEETPPSLYRRRQLIAASLATLLLGFGGGMAYTTSTWVREAKEAKRPSVVDLGFVRDMLDHHDQAVEMSAIVLNRPGISATVKHFAQEVIIFQRYEIGLMEGRLITWQEARGDDDRTAMAWMGMGTRADQMPGMATPRQLEKLKQASGTDADRLFLELMTAHHKGGVHMAEYAARRAKDDEVYALATRMVRNQELEIKEYDRALAELGG